MTNESCRTLEELFTNPPPNIPWTDLCELLKEVEVEYDGFFREAPGRIFLTLRAVRPDPSFPLEDTLRIQRSDIVFRGKAEAVAEFLRWAGVRPC